MNVSALVALIFRWKCMKRQPVENKYIATAKPVKNGRVELIHYIKEQKHLLRIPSIWQHSGCASRRITIKKRGPACLSKSGQVRPRHSSFSTGNGKETVNSLYFPSTLSTLTYPPCSRATFIT